ncbi:hypothetical protein C3B59_16315 [Cryobacterium zongtaii]|uniref:Uncharacterized protein n=1 Tax=Cryobacterium zongtaii TaxID=1259217 RepID=A0A2S3Z6A1_9MICO|nr:hypothetical protein [Cryobacterium zongtaii]POH60036.1 hypothetical protein C3B59_16315 [Cryobacterium zongtaii]
MVIVSGDVRDVAVVTMTVIFRHAGRLRRGFSGAQGGGRSRPRVNMPISVHTGNGQSQLLLAGHCRAGEEVQRVPDAWSA